MDGQPFFLINKEVDPGLTKVLEYEIVPRLEGMVPNQPSQERRASEPLLHRFTLIFNLSAARQVGRDIVLSFSLG